MVKLNIIEKNILTVEKGIIAHCCNTQKKMGAGLALAIRNMYPQVYQAYISKPNWELGDTQLVPVSADLVIANMATQDKCGTNKIQTSLNAFKECLHYIKGYADARDLPVFLPYYAGSGLAGGPTKETRADTWKAVSDLIYTVIPNAIICRKV